MLTLRGASFAAEARSGALLLAAVEGLAGAP